MWVPPFPSSEEGWGENSLAQPPPVQDKLTYRTKPFPLLIKKDQENYKLTKQNLEVATHLSFVLREPCQGSLGGKVWKEKDGGWLTPVHHFLAQAFPACS